MIFRDVGNTGKKAGVIGLGCEHLDGKPYDQVKSTIDAALECGINIFDLFMPGTEVRENISKALGARRKDVLIQGHICSTNIGQQYDISRDMPTVQKYFEELLRLCGGYIDFGMLFFIDSEDDYKKVFDTEIASYAQKLKEKGDIRHIGFSSHNPITAIKAVNTGLPEMMMFSINPAFDIVPTESSVLSLLEKGFNSENLTGIEPKRAELYRLCEQKNIGITVMKTLGAGKLISPEHTPFKRPLTVAQCVHYALSRPAVTSVLLGCKSPQEISEAVKYFEELLRLCGGYIDFGMLFFIDSEEDYKKVFDTEIASYAQKLKEKGDIRHIGFSSHNPITAIKAVNTGLPEMMMFSINPAFDIVPTEASVLSLLEKGFNAENLIGIEPKRAELYRLCEQKNIGITVMKTLGAGKLISPEHTPFKRPLTVAQCIHYALSRPAVTSVLLGCKSPQEISEAVKYFDLNDAELDYTDVLASVGSMHGSCVYCSHCQPCPSEIDIAAINKYLDIAKLDKSNIPPSIKSHYKNLAHNGSECTGCGNCEKRCPFGVEIIANMGEAEKLLG